MKKAVFPGSFDPIHLGHVDIVKRALVLFDEVIIGVGVNTTKQSYFTLEQRVEFINQAFKGIIGVTVMTYEGLTVDFCKTQGAQFILRGLRSGTDFEYERSIAQMNKAMASSTETVFLLTDPALSAITSSIIREIHKNKGSIERFIP